MDIFVESDKEIVRSYQEQYGYLTKTLTPDPCIWQLTSQIFDIYGKYNLVLYKDREKFIK